MEQNNKKTNGFAIAGLICSFFVALLGLIFSIIGLTKSKECNSGKGMSIAGIIISVLNILLGIIIIMVFPLLTLGVLSEMDTIMQEESCPNAYDCIINTDGTYSCSYINSEGEVDSITCDAEYINTY